MSGHSKWKKIKRQKGSADQKKGDTFTKLSQEITKAAREGGSGDLELNFMLRMVVDKAKEVNMPKDTIERAIDKGIGEGDKGPVESITYELVGTNGEAILVDCLTDNRNRTIGEIRKVISNYDFSLGSGGISWQFKASGRIRVKPYRVEKVMIKGREEEKLEKLVKDELMLEIIDIDGVIDVKEEGDEIVVLTEKNDLSKVYKRIQNNHIKIVEAGIVRLSKNKINLDNESLSKVEELINELEGLQDTVSVWDNVN